MSKYKGKRYSKEEREELLQLFGESGYSASRFCKEMGICYGTLKRWLSKRSPRFDLIELASPVAIESVALRVLLPNGIRCEIPSGFGRGEAADLIRELKAC